MPGPTQTYHEVRVSGLPQGRGQRFRFYDEAGALVKTVDKPRHTARRGQARRSR